MQKTVHLSKNINTKQLLKVLAIFIGINLLIGAIGGWITSYSVNNWYDSLLKPSWQPAKTVFAPVWTSLYVLIGIAGFLIWKAKEESTYIYYIQTRPAFQVYWLQLGLNLLWSFLFFGLKSPFLALLDIGILWFFIIVSMITFYPISRLASLLFVPYFFWVSFAMLLNLKIWLINPSIRFLTIPHLF